MDNKPLVLLALRKITKIFYRFRGFARVAEFVRRAFASYGRPVLVRDFDGDISIYCGLNEHMGSQIFWRGYYSVGQLKLLGRLLKNDSVFVDIGANQGEFTLFAAKRCRGGRVLAFEPVPEAVVKLRRNIELNDFKNIKVYPLGLSDKENTCCVYSSAGAFFDGTVHEGLFTTHPTEQRKSPVCDIRVVPLDSVEDLREIPKIDVMKIDVEGSELEVLKGASDTIKKFRPVIIVEAAEDNCRSAGYTAADIPGYLKSFSYSFELINDDGTTRPLKDAWAPGSLENIICQPQE